MDFRQIALKEILTITFTLFAVIDMVGTIPILASLRMKMGGEIRSAEATFASGALMILFLFLGQSLVNQRLLLVISPLIILVLKNLKL